jgi:hypothetical protein
MPRISWMYEPYAYVRLAEESLVGHDLHLHHVRL